MHLGGEHSGMSPKRCIEIDGGTAGPGGGGEGRNIALQPIGGGGEVVGPVGCRRRRRRRGPRTAGRGAGGGERVSTAESLPPRATGRGRDGQTGSFCKTAPEPAGVAIGLYAHALHAGSRPKPVRRVCKRGKPEQT